MKIYTKTGDTGQTSLVGGQRVSKCCQRIESYGIVDELNSHIGVLMAEMDNVRDLATLQNIQRTLFVLGGYLATDTSERDPRVGNIIEPSMVAAVEQEIDRLQTSLPPLRLFILPGGTRAAAFAHVCRTVCRRCEREILRLAAECTVDAAVLTYVNRLSDYFFVLARKLNADAAKPDIVWQRNSNS